MKIIFKFLTIQKRFKPIEAYVGYSNSTLKTLPIAYAGDLIDCPHCFEKHELVASRDTENPEIVLAYKCHGKVYIGAVHGRLVANIRPDKTGTVRL
jgi:hypothetical protein